MKTNDVKKKPCAKCPYKLGTVKTLINPCPQCKQNGYDFYERFLKMPRQEDFSGVEKERTLRRS